jgi:hypothetical protein
LHEICTELRVNFNQSNTRCGRQNLRKEEEEEDKEKTGPSGLFFLL